MRFVSLAVVALVIAACGKAPLTPTDGDIVPSSTVDVAAIQGWEQEDGFYVSPILDAPTGATRVALIARVAEGADVSFFARAVDDVTWVPAEVTWRDSAYRDDRFVARADLLKVATAVQLKIDARDIAKLRSITFEAIVPMPQNASATTSSTTTAEQAVLDGFQPRSAWGARAANGCDGNTNKTKITVHHTVSRLHDGGTRDQLTAEIRSAQSLHMDGRGYCDIGYHFLVTSDGTVWAGRNMSQLGAHTGGQNTNNLGVSFVGCFHPTSDCDGLGSTTPPQRMIDGAGAFIGRAARHYGITLTVGSTLMGHRDNPGQSTACPGDRLHAKLGELRTIANGAPPPPPAATTGKVQGLVWNLAITADAGAADDLGAQLPGASVVVKKNGAQVAAGAARAADAYWSFDLAPGTYVITADKDGFAPSNKEVTIASGDNRWSSIGIAPEVQAVDVGVVVVDSATDAPIANAQVTVTGHEAQPTSSEGRVNVVVPPGAITIAVAAEGYVSKTETRTAVNGTPLTVNVALDLVDVTPPPDEGEEGEGEEGEAEEPVIEPEGSTVERVVIRNKMTPKVTGGCSAGGAAGSVLLLLPLLRRRRYFFNASP